MGFRVATVVQMVGVIALALRLRGVFHSIHEGNTIGRAVTVGGLLVMRVGMIFLWLRAARQDQPGVRPDRPMRSRPPWRRSARSRCRSPAPPSEWSCLVELVAPPPRTQQKGGLTCLLDPIRAVAAVSSER